MPLVLRNPKKRAESCRRRTNPGFRAVKRRRLRNGHPKPGGIKRRRAKVIKGRPKANRKRRCPYWQQREHSKNDRIRVQPG